MTFKIGLKCHRRRPQMEFVSFLRAKKEYCLAFLDHYIDSLPTIVYIINL